MRLSTFFNTDTGILTGGRDRNGRLHGRWFVYVNGIGFGPDGFRLEPWSTLKGKRVPLGQPMDMEHWKEQCRYRIIRMWPIVSILYW